MPFLNVTGCARSSSTAHRCRHVVHPCTCVMDADCLTALPTSPVPPASLTPLSFAFPCYHHQLSLPWYALTKRLPPQLVQRNYPSLLAAKSLTKASRTQLVEALEQVSACRIGSFMCCARVTNRCAAYPSLRTRGLEAPTRRYSECRSLDSRPVAAVAVAAAGAAAAITWAITFADPVSHLAVGRFLFCPPGVWPYVQA